MQRMLGCCPYIMQADLKRTADIGSLWFYFFFLIQFSSHVLQAQQRGTQPTPTSQMATGWKPAAWSGASPSRYTVLASVVCWAAHHPPAPLTYPITWT